MSIIIILYIIEGRQPRDQYIMQCNIHGYVGTYSQKPLTELSRLIIIVILQTYNKQPHVKIQKICCQYTSINKCAKSS